MLKRKIRSSLRDYNVYYSRDFEFIDDIRNIEDSFYVVDKKVYNLYPEYFKGVPQERLYLFDAIEENKTLASAISLYEELVAKGFKKSHTLISFGGGITQDTAGFVASTLYRGVPWICVPTTLLAQADSCIGGKTSLNFLDYKNILGTFYPPEKVYVDSAFIKTLSDLDFYSGVGEIIKMLLLDVNDKVNLEDIERIKDVSKEDTEELLSFIEKSHEIKIEHIEADEFDGGKRNMLNFGHCFGHALEVTSNYKVPHGIAVIIGMVYANIASKNRGLLSAEQCDEINRRCLLDNIPIKLEKEYFKTDKLLDAMKKDKKRTGKDLAMILLDETLRPIMCQDFTASEFEGNLEDLQVALMK